MPYTVEKMLTGARQWGVYNSNTLVTYEPTEEMANATAEVHEREDRAYEHVRQALLALRGEVMLTFRLDAQAAFNAIKFEAQKP